MTPDSTTSSLELSLAQHESYVKADPHNALLWLALGDFYHRAARFEEAVAAFRRCLVELPQHPAARNRLASVRISPHRLSHAQASLAGLLRGGRGSAAPFYN